MFNMILVKSAAKVYKKKGKKKKAKRIKKKLGSITMGNISKNIVSSSTKIKLAKFWHKIEHKLNDSDLSGIQAAMSGEIDKLPSELREHLNFEEFTSKIMEARSLRDLNPEGEFMDGVYENIDINLGIDVPHDVDGEGISEIISTIFGALLGAEVN